MSSKKKIISGYNGVIDLDLTNVPEKDHQEMIEQHQKDIKEYKLDQASRPKHLRYENVVPKIMKMLENDAKEIRKRKEMEEEEWFKKHDVSRRNES